MTVWYISRHGEAEQLRTRDEERALTHKGEAQVRSLWLGLRSELDVFPSVVLASPYLRAQQTAAIIAEVLDIAEIVTANELTPEASVSGALDYFSGLPKTPGGYVVVSHMPLVGLLAARWYSGISAAGVNFSVAQVLALHGKAGLGKAALLWSQKP